MATYRIGIGSFSLAESGGVGIATDTTDIKLVIGNEGTTKANYNITGIASLTNYAGFADRDQNIDGTVTLTGEYSTLGDIVVGLGNTVTISGIGTTVTTGTSGLSSTPPVGGEKCVPILTLSTVPTVTVAPVDTVNVLFNPTTISPIV